MKSYLISQSQELGEDGLPFGRVVLELVLVPEVAHEGGNRLREGGAVHM